MVKKKIKFAGVIVLLIALLTACGRAKEPLQSNKIGEIFKFDDIDLKNILSAAKDRLSEFDIEIVKNPMEMEGQELLEIDPEIMSYVKEYVELDEDEKIKDYEWMKYEGNRVLRIKIDYAELPEDKYPHKKDYFLFMKTDETVSQVLLVDYEDKELLRFCSFEAHFEDVTFDGKEDLIIELGAGGSVFYYCAYVYENNGFRYESTFEKIPSYKVDVDKKVIYGWNTNGTGQFYDTTYAYKNGEFVCVNSDNYTIINDEKIPIPEELLHDWNGYWEWYEGLKLEYDDE